MLDLGVTERLVLAGDIMLLRLVERFSLSPVTIWKGSSIYYRCKNVMGGKRKRVRNKREIKMV